MTTTTLLLTGAVVVMDLVLVVGRLLATINLSLSLCHTAHANTSSTITITATHIVVIRRRHHKRHFNIHTHTHHYDTIDITPIVQLPLDNVDSFKQVAWFKSKVAALVGIRVGGDLRR
jgi:hypothetical protein